MCHWMWRRVPFNRAYAVKCKLWQRVRCFASDRIWLAGSSSGKICYYGRDLKEVGHRQQSQEIGYVLQNPENQIVTDKVWHELAFGLESLGYDTPTIRLRVAEMASYFGIHQWFYKNVSELSGGQKQL